MRSAHSPAQMVFGDALRSELHTARRTVAPSESRGRKRVEHVLFVLIMGCVDTPSRDRSSDRIEPAKLVDTLTADPSFWGCTSASSVRTLGRILNRLAQYLHAVAVVDVAEISEAHVRGFLGSRRSDGSEVSPASYNERLTALRRLFLEARVNGYLKVDPSANVPHIPAETTVARPLTDIEASRCRTCAVGLDDPRRPLVWALAELGARTPEIAAVLIGDVQGDRVWLHGDGRVEARWATLTDWGGRQIRRRCTDPTLGPQNLLVPNANRAQPSAGSGLVLRDIFGKADLYGQPGIKPLSVSAWVGQKALREGARIEDVARLLGFRSLDLTARLLAFDWQRTEGS